ncbi:MAG: hypothetical protein H0T46_21315 [Deltaproteobacteria bacterium]|nr:hypothetical protein [Deltaproteobacteria bacterium]
MGRCTTLAGLAALAALAAIASAGPESSRPKVTIWAAPVPTATIYGGLSYGGHAPVTGALISERRDVDVSASGEVRVPGVAATIDAASVQLRDITDPSATITEQRFIAGASTPTELLQRHAGNTIIVVTPKGELTGVLRSADEQVIVIEIGSGDQRRLQILRRDGYVQDVRLPAGAGMDKPSLVWKLASKKQGKHTVELTYRADGMVWTADYLAVLDEPGTSIAFSAWATVKNTTGGTYDNAELTLVSAGPANLAATSNRATPVPTRYAIAKPVHLGSGQSVQVELLPTRLAAKARSVITYEAMPDPSLGFQAYPNTDCNQFNGVGMGRSEIAVEVDVPTKEPLPDGRVRLFRKKADRLEVISEEQLRSSAGLARIRVAPNNDINGERRAVSCNYDERLRTVTEKIEVKIENKAKRASEIVIREFAWRWPVWRLDSEDVKSARAGTQTLEYRATVPPGGKKTVTYAVTYTW